jgi:hypothetical protein
VVGNNKLYVTGFLKNQTSANTGIGILNPDLTFVKLADSAPQEKSYDINRPPVLKGLAVTDKYIVAWKVPTKNTVGNLYHLGYRRPLSWTNRLRTKCLAMVGNPWMPQFGNIILSSWQPANSQVKNRYKWVQVPMSAPWTETFGLAAYSSCI